MTWLFDGNVLIAMMIEAHPHHERVVRWMETNPVPFATCSVTQGTLLRLHMLSAPDKSAAAARRSLRAIMGMPAHVFWDDGFSYLSVPHQGIQGYKQVTDAWLAQLARQRGGKLATLDDGLATQHRDVALLVPL